MNSTPFFWFVKNNYWQAVETKIKQKGIDLNLSPIETFLDPTAPILFTDQLHSLPLPEFKKQSTYKILLLATVESAAAHTNLLDFDEIWTQPLLSSEQVSAAIQDLPNKAKAKCETLHHQQAQIQLLKQLEQEIESDQLSLNDLQKEAAALSLSSHWDLLRNNSLFKFILLLSREMEIGQILNLVWKDFIAIRGTLNIFMAQENTNGMFRFYQKNQGLFLYKNTPFKISTEEAAFNEPEWQNQVTKVLHSHCEQFFVLPLHKYFKNKFSVQKTFLLIEHQYTPDENAQNIKYISERLPFIAMAIEKSRVTDELISKNKLWENTFDGITDPLVIIDRNYKIVRSNQNFNIHLKSKICYVSFAGLKKPCEACPLPVASDSVENIQQSYHSELVQNNKVFLARSYPLSKGFSNNYYINHYSDVTQERELFIQTLNIEKMRSLDSFAGQLSQNLTKPLTEINTCMNANQAHLNFPDALEIEKAVRRSELILQNLTEFAKGNPNLILSPVDPIIDSTLPFFKSLSRRHKIYLHLDSRELITLVSPPLLQQVIFNLVNNACQAMPQPGKVTITSRSEALNEIPGVRVEVLDNGPGIPENLRQQIFKSAFTTKEIKKGTGLGLKICQFIIQGFQGQIGYDPIKPHGSQFWIWIPQANHVRVN